MKDYLKGIDHKQGYQRNPWLPILKAEVEKCKVRGNFRSSNTKDQSCEGKESKFSSLEIDQFTLHLMKGITAAFYGIQDMTVANSKLDKLSIDYRYKKILQVEIPKVLEDVRREDLPFTQPDTNSSTYGNGNVGFTIKHIKRESGTVRYVFLAQTGTNMKGELGRFETGLQFYKASLNITSTSDACKPRNISHQSPEIYDNLIIVVAAICACTLLMVVVSVIAAACCISRSKWFFCF